MFIVFMVYKTDVHHSYASRDIIGVALTEEFAISICKKQAKKEGHKIKKQELWNLQHLKQTQGYDGIGEFQYEPVTTNTLL